MKDKEQYVTVAPATAKGKWLVCSRRLGSRNRLAPIAECRIEVVAEKIVDGLNALQGDLSKIEVPLQRTLDQLRAQLADELAKFSKLRQDIRDRDNKINSLTTELFRVQRERDAAQQKAREVA